MIELVNNGKIWRDYRLSFVFKLKIIVCDVSLVDWLVYEKSGVTRLLVVYLRIFNAEVHIMTQVARLFYNMNIDARKVFQDTEFSLFNLLMKNKEAS